MKKNRFFPLILLIAMLLASTAPAAHALEEPALDAKAVVLADMNSGEIIYSKNMDDKRAPASLTKIMTALLAVEAIENGECSLDDVVTAKSDCRLYMDESSSTSGILPGEKMTFEDLLYCAMLQSANEACNIIASHVSGNIDAFVAKMNEKAANLGCANTHFVTTNGLSFDGHYSTAYDLFLITREAMRHPDFVTLCNTVSHEVPATNMADGRHLANSNALISKNAIYNQYGRSYLYEYASGVKTGYTSAAGYCLISTAEKDGIQVLAVVLGCSGPLNGGSEDSVGNFVNTLTLYDWVFANYSYRTLTTAGENVGELSVEYSDSGKAVLCPVEDVTKLLPNDLDISAIQRKVTLYDENPIAPIKAGTVLGELSLSMDGVDYGTVKLVNSNGIDLSRGEYLKQQFTAIFSKGWVIALIIVILVLLTIYLILVIRYRKLRRRHLQERRRAEQRRRMEAEQRSSAKDRADDYDTAYRR